jgi:acetyl esterase/lipase
VPVVSIDEITRQARAAVAWVLRNIARHGGDPQRVAIGGHSAGAHLAAMCLQTDWKEDYGLPVDPLAGAVLVSGLYDLEPLRYSYLRRASSSTTASSAATRRPSACAPGATPVRITWARPKQSEFARQSQVYHAAWRAAGNRGDLVRNPAPITHRDPWLRGSGQQTHVAGWRGCWGSHHELAGIDPRRLRRARMPVTRIASLREQFEHARRT